MKERQWLLAALLMMDLCLAGALCMRQSSPGARAPEVSLMEQGEAGLESEEEEPEEVWSRDDKLVALTFDDGPHPVYTEQLLNGLAERGVKATFFLIGTNVEGQEALVRRMAEDGHVIGGHTYSHVQLTRLPLEEACEEINRTNEVLEKIIKKQVLYIRPPFGTWSNALEMAVNQVPVLWNVDPMDWKGKGVNEIITHVIEKVKERDIILLHDIYAESVQAALEIVDRLQEEGYTFVTVDEVILD